jgi:hypothetical protein
LRYPTAFIVLIVAEEQPAAKQNVVHYLIIEED